MEFPDLDLDAARQFLDAIHPADDDGNGSSLIAVQGIVKGAKHPDFTEFYSTVDAVLDDAARFEDAQRRGACIYVSLGRLRARPASGRGGKADVASRASLFVDGDAKDHGGSKAAALDALRKLPVEPSILVDSGHGYHVHLLLKEPTTFNGDPQTVEHFEAVQRALATVAGGDAVADVSRLCGLPGTWNVKDPADPLPVAIVEFNADRRCNLCDFDDLPPADDAGKTTTDGDDGAAGTLDAPDSLDDLKVSDRIAKVIAGPAKYVGDGKPYASRSEATQGVIWAMIGAGYTDETIRDVVLANPIGAKAHEQRDPAAWLASEVARARAAGAKPRIAGDLPQVSLDDRPLRDKSDDALAALVSANNPPSLFRRARGLARVATDEDGRALIAPIGEAELRGMLMRACDFVAFVGKRGVPRHADPPIVIVRDILALAGWTFPALVAVTEHPILRPDGSVLTTPGYDPATRLFFHPGAALDVPPIPDVPSRDEAQAAAAFVDDEVLVDFPFDCDASRANALALLLTPIVRPAVTSHVPMAVLDAPRRRTGKTLLVSAVHSILTGRPAPLSGAPDGDDDAEWAKMLLATLLEGATFVALDNIEGTLRSPSLCRAITADRFKGRVLGHTRMADAPQRACFCCTGNNVRVEGDLPPRCYWIRLDPKSARPEQRAGFRHPDLLAWSVEHRGRLLGALLTMARGWAANARPVPDDRPPVGGFESWADTVGGILDFAGVPGFLGNEEAWRERQNQEEAEVERFLAAWHEAYGEKPVTAKDLKADLDAPTDLLPDVPSLLDALPPRLGETYAAKPQSFTRALAHLLRKIEGTRFGDSEAVVEQAKGTTRSGAALWVVHTAPRA